jgi:hypothetical protein
MKGSIFLSILFLICLFACKKDAKLQTVNNNNAPYYSKIPRVKVENYVNRLFIDLIGREAFDVELKAETDKMIEANLSADSRETLIYKLQKDKSWRAGDSSFCIAYNKQLYELLCVRLCEGFSEPEFMYQRGIIEFACVVDSLNGNWGRFYENKQRSKELLWAARARWDFMDDSIKIDTYCMRLVNNTVTFNKTLSYMGNEDNTIKYTFNDFFFRQYTQNEFLLARDMILNGKATVLFGRSGSSKGDYFDIICHSQEFYEGTIKWLYKTFISRNPSTEETVNALKIIYNENKDIVKIQRHILKTDEYANFRN